MNAEPSRLDSLLDEAEYLHRHGRQRTALTVLSRLVDLVRTDSESRFDELLQAILLRKRVLRAMREG